MNAIFTSEPMINRALAAEIRHYPNIFTNLVEERLGLGAGTLGEMTEVRCEGIGDIDITITYVKDQISTTVGLESKFDHELTANQIEKQLKALANHGGGHLIFVLPEVTDAPQFPHLNILSWKEVLSSFTASRLTEEDIDGMPLTKRQIERSLEAIDFKNLLDTPGWSIDVQRNGSGNPSIEFRSLPLPSGRQIRGQIQVVSRGIPKEQDNLRFEYHIGIQINTTDEDFPLNGGDEPPAWVIHLSTLHDKILTEESLPNFSVSLRAAPERSKEAKEKKANPYWDSKIVIADKHLGTGKRWLVKGYTDGEGWALGIKSLPHGINQLPDLCKTAALILNSWLAVEQSAELSR